MCCAHSICAFVLLAVAACEVPNPAYDPLVWIASDAGNEPPDGQKVLVDAADADPIVVDAPLVPDDGPAPPDAPLLKLDAERPPDTMVKTDIALTPDASVDVDHSRLEQSCAPDPSLVLCMAFEDSANDLSSLMSSFETLELAYQPGKMGMALLSSASTRIVNNNLSTAAVPSVTIQAWLNPARLPSVGRRFGILDYQPQYSMFILPSGQITCGCDMFRDLTTTPLIKVNAWQSVACTIGNQAIKIWINGYVRSEIAIDTICPAANDNTGMAVLGNVTLGGSPYPDSFEGLADNVRVWRRVRTAEEICRDALVCEL